MSEKSYRVLANRNELSEDEWLDVRRGNPPDEPRIGSSDAAGVLGVSRWTSTYSLYLEKRGEIEPEDLSDNRFVKSGNYLEEPIARWAADEMGWDIQRRYQVLQHPEHDWMIANVDFEIINQEEEDGTGVLEIKNQNIRRRPDWIGPNGEELVPLETIAQVHHQKAVKQTYTFGYVAALIGGNELIIRRVDKNEDLIGEIESLEKNFVQSIREGNPPDVDGTKSCRESLYSQYDTSEGEVEIEDGEADELVQKLDEWKDEKSELEDEIDEAKNRLVDIVGDHRKASIFADGEWRTFVNITSSGTNVDTVVLQEKYPDVYDEVVSTYEYTYPRLY